jgi:hypothetical protein
VWPDALSAVSFSAPAGAINLSVKSNFHAIKLHYSHTSSLAGSVAHKWPATPEMSKFCCKNTAWSCSVLTSLDVRSFFRMAASIGATACAGDIRLLNALEGPLSSKARFLLAASLFGDAVLLPVTLVKIYLHMSDGMIRSTFA